MGSPLPELTRDEFRVRLHQLVERELPPTVEVPSTVESALWAHYVELRRWNPRLSLVGPGTADLVLERHYVESLAGLELLTPERAPGVRTLVDVGSGGGFPGFVLAAARPDLDVTLVEPRQRKQTFLATAVRRAGLLSCRVVGARVERPFPTSLRLPTAVDRVTVRALAMPPAVFEAFVEHSPAVRFLLWCGKDDPRSPPGLEARAEIRLGASRHRRILEIASKLERS